MLNYFDSKLQFYNGKSVYQNKFKNYFGNVKYVSFVKEQVQ